MPPLESEVQQTSAVPKPNPRNNVTMFKIFQNVQYNVVQHKKYVKEMTKLYKKLDEGAFRESFKNALQYLFTFGDTSANVDRVIQFVATFCTSLDDEEEFLMFIFEIIFECQCVSGQSVRYRASQLLAAVLSALGEDACLDDELCDKLLESQMQRLQDTRGAVRCRAALALNRLQNPPDDDVTRAYRFHMSCDPSSSVRRAVLMSIAKCKPNVPFVLERLCDVDESVRRAAFLYMSAMPVTQLKVTQRILTLKVGLTERSPRVRRVVEEILIPGWLSTFRGNIIDLLKAIRLDNSNDAKDSQYVAGKLCESLFKRLTISELLEWLPTEKNLRIIPAEKLNKETAWYWRHLAEHLQRIEDDETLETVVPDLVVLTEYIKAVVESPCPDQKEDPVAFSTRQYVLHELASMLRVYDASDPAGRTALQALITDTLTGDYGPLNEEVIRAFVGALEMVLPEVNQRMEVIAGVINSLRDPPEPDLPPPPAPAVNDDRLKIERTRLRVSLNVAMEAQLEAVREQNYDLATEWKEKVAKIHKKLDELQVQPVIPEPQTIATIKEKQCDSETLNKCLIILNSALDTPQLNTVTPMLNILFSELKIVNDQHRFLKGNEYTHEYEQLFVWEQLSYSKKVSAISYMLVGQEEILNNPDILENALQTVTLYGMLDKKFANDKEHKKFIFTKLMNQPENIVTTALKCIVDLLCVHGVRVFEDDELVQNDTAVTNSTRRTTTHSVNGYDSADGTSTVSDSISPLPSDRNDVIEVLLSIMDKASAVYRLIVVEGMCRLMHLGHLESPSILSRLLLLWFNPATVEEDMLRQTIGVFFQTFPTSVDGAQEQIQKATLPTLRTLANAPTSSPLAEIDQEEVVRFIVSLTKVNHELIDSQGGMGLLLTNFLSRKPTAPEVGLVCRMLALLATPREACLASQLANTLRDVITKLPDKQSQRNLTRYLGALEVIERTSLNNKLSNTGITEGTIQNDDTMQQTMQQTGRATTSLPQPIARSTHVVINETVEEEVEIEEASPTDPISKISTESTQPSDESPKTPSPNPGRSSSGSESGATETAEPANDSSDGISPEKKAKVSKAKKQKKKLSINRNSDEKAKPKGKESQKEKDKKEGGKKSEENEKGGVKRSRSQRSVVDVERAQKAKAEKAKKAQEKEQEKSPPMPPEDLDVSNVTVRKSIRGVASGSNVESNPPEKSKKKGGVKKKETAAKSKAKATRQSAGSRSSVDSPHFMSDDSGDDTELHTIVYDQDIQQSLLNDSSELADSKRISKGNVTVPETPDGSEESESEPSPEPVKGKRNGKKK